MIRKGWEGVGIVSESMSVELHAFFCPSSRLFLLPRKKCSDSVEHDIIFGSFRCFTFVVEYHAEYALGIVIILMLTAEVERCVHHHMAGRVVKQFLMALPYYQ